MRPDIQGILKVNETGYKLTNLVSLIDHLDQLEITSEVARLTRTLSNDSSILSFFKKAMSDPSLKRLQTTNIRIY